MEQQTNPAKDFLNRYQNMVRRRESLLREIDVIRARATSTSIRIKDVNVKGSSKIHDQMAESAAMLADSTAMLDNLVKEIDTALSEILMAIESVDDEKQKTVLTLRYIEGLSWQHVQVRMAYEHSQVMVLHGRALSKIRDYIKLRTKTDTTP